MKTYTEIIEIFIKENLNDEIDRLYRDGTEILKSGDREQAMDVLIKAKNTEDFVKALKVVMADYEEVKWVLNGLNK